MTVAGEVRVGAVLCDLDGVVHRGGVPVPGAVDALRRLAVPVRYVTNNASRGPGEVADRLTGFGISCRPEDVVTSALAAARELGERFGAGARVLVVGADALARAVEAEGLVAVRPGGDGAVDVVVQGWGPQVSAHDLGVCATTVRAGVPWVVTNLDATLPTELGPVPGNGALVGTVVTASGREPDTVAGKPHPHLHRWALASVGVPPEQALAVGDRLDTDVRAARRAGVRSVLVLSGVASLDDVLDAPSDARPDVVVPDLGWLPGVIEGDPAALALGEAVGLVHALRDAGEDAEVAVAAARRAHAATGAPTVASGS